MTPQKQYLATRKELFDTINRESPGFTPEAQEIITSFLDYVEGSFEINNAMRSYLANLTNYRMMSSASKARKIFPNESYTAGEIYGIAEENYMPVEDTNISPDLKILEVIACFHEQNELGECTATDDSDHETFAEFRSEDGERYFLYE